MRFSDHAMGHIIKSVFTNNKIGVQLAGVFLLTQFQGSFKALLFASRPALVHHLL